MTRFEERLNSQSQEIQKIDELQARMEEQFEMYNTQFTDYKKDIMKQIEIKMMETTKLFHQVMGDCTR